jgi:hypothetical protein
MDCFVAFAPRKDAARVVYGTAHWNSMRIAMPERFARTHTRKNFFIIFVDGIFTTFIACLFTNTSDAIRENRTISCVSHACHAD